jgi:hypothetical protein
MASSALMAALAVMAQPIPAFAQQVTSSLRGQLSGGNGDIAGATVKLINTKTGATLTTSSSSGGAFAFSGLDVGGPYTLVVSASGFDKKTITGIYLTVGETSNLDIDLSALDVETVVVSGVHAQGGATALVETRGLSTSFTAADIKNTPTIERDLKDIVQKTPYAFVDPVGGGSSPPVPTLNIAGSSGRCSNLLVDGLQQKDNFGLNSQGYPTARAPIPNDWAEQIQVAALPYDVQYNDTCGGVVNIVTKSGSNDFHGTGYFYYKDAGMGGDGLAPFVERSYGATVSGPIIEDKLFFFLGYDELQRTSSPGSSAIGPNGSGYNSVAANISQAQVDQVAAIAQSVYGFDAGDFRDNFTEYNQRYIAKLTWQISDNHRRRHAGDRRRLDLAHHAGRGDAVELVCRRRKAGSLFAAVLRELDQQPLDRNRYRPAPRPWRPDPARRHELPRSLRAHAGRQRRLQSRHLDDQQCGVG